MNMTEAQIQQALASWLDGGISPEDHERLERTLAQSADARRVYLEFLSLHAELSNRSVADRHLQSLAFFDDDREPAAVASPRWRRAPWRVSAYAAAAAIVLAVTGAVALVPAFQQSGQQGVATLGEAGGSTAAEAGTDPLGAEADGAKWYVAQLTGASNDVRWGAAVRQEFLLRYRPGDRLVVKEGLVELEYYTGARIVLKGPCDFLVTGENSGRLGSGTLTGHVSEGDFVLTTMAAEVIDLGTAFCVSHDRSGNTDVFVLDGEVSVSDSLAGEGRSSRLLKQGQSARIASSGGVTPLEDPWPEARVLSSPDSAGWHDAAEKGAVSLVDLVSSPRVDRFRLAGVIAPDSGEADRHPWLRPKGPGHSISQGFKKTDWHDFVDGVFIPQPEGVATQVDSHGARVDLPKSLGTTWGPLWSRRRSDGLRVRRGDRDYWGTGTLAFVIDRLGKCRDGMIGMHSNVGITFDLQAVQDQWNRRPARLRGVVGNLDNSMTWTGGEWAAKNRFSASFWVFVDGEFRHSRVDFAREDGEANFEVDLRDGDRFLTIISTDAMDVATARPDAFDHVVLIDPVLELEPVAEQAARPGQQGRGTPL